MQDTLLSVSNLKVRLNNNLILGGVDFIVKEGETLAIIGPNGAGKTVLFRALLGLIPFSGVIKWKQGIKIGYVPQKLFIDTDLPLTVAEFFELKGVKRQNILSFLEEVGFSPEKLRSDNILNRRIGVLSGGELQRIMIAWALSGHPDVILFDEPTTGIDVGVEETIYGLLHRLSRKENITVFLISHELQVVYKYADNVVCLNKQTLCFGPPKEVLDKESMAKLFGGEMGIYQHHKH